MCFKKKDLIQHLKIKKKNPNPTENFQVLFFYTKQSVDDRNSNNAYDNGNAAGQSEKKSWSEKFNFTSTDLMNGNGALSPCTLASRIVQFTNLLSAMPMNKPC